MNRHIHHEPIYLLDKYELTLDKIEHHFTHAHGHGGQNINKVATKVQLRVEINQLPLPQEMREKLLRKFPQGHVEVNDQTTRHQHENMKNALKKLKHLIEENLK